MILLLLTRLCTGDSKNVSYFLQIVINIKYYLKVAKKDKTSPVNSKHLENVFLNESETVQSVTKDVQS